MAEPRKATHNLGAVMIREAPDDRYFVGAFVVMMDDAGRYSVHFKEITASPIFGFASAQVPEEGTLQEIAGAMAQAWGLANLPTTED